MIYRELGRTGLKVSQLGFGAMRLPMRAEDGQQRVDRDLAVPMIRRAFEAGVNYIDTGILYCNHDSQRAVGDALQGWRDRVYVSTKNHYYPQEEGEWWKHLEDSLDRLQVDQIDLYSHHQLTWKTYAEDVEPRVSRWMTKALDQGLINHICCSFHDTNENLIRLIDTGYFEVITLQYNMLYRELEEGIAHAHERGVGVVVMGPIGGGRLAATSSVLEEMVPGIRRVPELALRFVLANRNVSVALSGMSTIAQVEENARVAGDSTSLSEQDRLAIDEHLVRLSKMAELYCSACGYCMPCPNEVNIPVIFAHYNTGRVYGLWQIASEGYSQIGEAAWVPGARADACTQCGLCEEKCPQHLQIRRQLSDAHGALKSPQ